MDQLAEAAATGLPIIETIASLIAKAKGASAEDHAAIMAQLTAAEKALADAQASARSAIDADTQATKDAITKP